jgi:predicted pyridoxine 5'-phosphate oxidase superfamily flavin-nucleotide-binding protein
MSYRDHLITSIEQLRTLYGDKSKGAVLKEIDRLNSGYRKLIEAAPFAIVATAGPEGLDCSPKGDAPGFVRILRDSRIALLFLIPGVGETLRVNGRASITVDPGLMQSFAVDGRLPRCVLVVHIESVYFHCSKAIVRSKLWDERTKVDRASLPSTGTLVAELSHGELGGEAYDREAPERIKAALY